MEKIFSKHVTDKRLVLKNIQQILKQYENEQYNLKMDKISEQIVYKKDKQIA